MPIDSRPNPPVAQSARRREARKSRGSADPALQIPAFRVWPDRGYGVDFLISATCAETLWGKRHEKIARDIQLGLALLSLAIASAAQEPKALPLPDERYKADILLV